MTMILAAAPPCSQAMLMADFQSRFDKSTAQAEQMKEGARCGFCDYKRNVYRLKKC
jgi:hypothetical protein